MVSATIRASDTIGGYRPGWPLFSSAGDLVGHADHPRTGVGSDDGADVADNHALARHEGLEHLDELVEVGRIAVHHGQVVDLPFVAHLVGEIPQGTRTSALPGL